MAPETPTLDLRGPWPVKVARAMALVHALAGTMRCHVVSEEDLVLEFELPTSAGLTIVDETGEADLHPSGSAPVTVRLGLHGTGEPTRTVAERFR